MREGYPVILLVVFCLLGTAAWVLIDYLAKTGARAVLKPAESNRHPRNWEAKHFQGTDE